VHFDDGRGFFVRLSVSLCVEAKVFSDGVPIVYCEAVVVGGVDDGEPALRERYSAEAIAIAEAPVEQHDKNS